MQPPPWVRAQTKPVVCWPCLYSKLCGPVLVVHHPAACLCRPLPHYHRYWAHTQATRLAAAAAAAAAGAQARSNLWSLRRPGWSRGQQGGQPCSGAGAAGWAACIWCGALHVHLACAGPWHTYPQAHRRAQVGVGYGWLLQPPAALSVVSFMRALKEARPARSLLALIHMPLWMPAPLCACVASEVQVLHCRRLQRAVVCAHTIPYNRAQRLMKQPLSAELPPDVCRLACGQGGNHEQLLSSCSACKSYTTTSALQPGWAPCACIHMWQACATKACPPRVPRRSGNGWQRFIRRGLHTLRHSQYQLLVCILEGQHIGKGRHLSKQLRAAEVVRSWLLQLPTLGFLYRRKDQEQQSSGDEANLPNLRVHEGLAWGCCPKPVSVFYAIP